MQTPVLASPTAKAENKYINFYLSYRTVRTIKEFLHLQRYRYSSFENWDHDVLMSPRLREKKKPNQKSKLTSHYFFFLRFGFFFPLKMETCLPPALSLCKTKNTRSPAFSRGYVCIHDVIILILLYYTKHHRSVTDAVKSINTRNAIKGFCT